MKVNGQMWVLERRCARATRQLLRTIRRAGIRWPNFSHQISQALVHNRKARKP
jgi:hypothetical protein